MKSAESPHRIVVGVRVRPLHVDPLRRTTDGVSPRRARSPVVDCALAIDGGTIFFSDVFRRRVQSPAFHGRLAPAAAAISAAIGGAAAQSPRRKEVLTMLRSPHASDRRRRAKSTSPKGRKLPHAIRGCFAGGLHHFQYDHCFGPRACYTLSPRQTPSNTPKVEQSGGRGAARPVPLDTQAVVYSAMGKPAVMAVIAGYHGCVIAYGQTGSGKTYSMIGPSLVESIAAYAACGRSSRLKGSWRFVTEYPTGAMASLDEQPALRALAREARTFAEEPSTSRGKGDSPSTPEGGSSRFAHQTTKAPSPAELARSVERHGRACTDDSLLRLQNVQDRGMMVRAAEDIFSALEARQRDAAAAGRRYVGVVTASFYQLYREKAWDLLVPGVAEMLTTSPILPPPIELLDSVRKQPLRTRFTTAHGAFLDNLTCIEVRSVTDVLRLLDFGVRNRLVAGTTHNLQSSRSHALLVLNVICALHPDGSPSPVEADAQNKAFPTCASTLHFVDLAGSERVGQLVSGSKGMDRDVPPTSLTHKSAISKQAGIPDAVDCLTWKEFARFRISEASDINASLSALGNVIHILSEHVVQGRKGAPLHVPYRDSLLTLLLRNCFGGTSKTYLLATVSPLIHDADETLSTLRFCRRAKLILNEPVKSVGKRQRLTKHSPRDAVVQRRKDMFTVEENHVRQVLGSYEGLSPSARLTRGSLGDAHWLPESPRQMVEQAVGASGEYPVASPTVKRLVFEGGTTPDDQLLPGHLSYASTDEEDQNVSVCLHPGAGAQPLMRRGDNMDWFICDEANDARGEPADYLESPRRVRDEAQLVVPGDPMDDRLEWPPASKARVPVIPLHRIKETPRPTTGEPKPRPRSAPPSSRAHAPPPVSARSMIILSEGFVEGKTNLEVAHHLEVASHALACRLREQASAPAGRLVLEPFGCETDQEALYIARGVDDEMRLIRAGDAHLPAPSRRLPAGSHVRLSHPGSPRKVTGGRASGDVDERITPAQDPFDGSLQALPPPQELIRRADSPAARAELNRVSSTVMPMLGMSPRSSGGAVLAAVRTYSSGLQPSPSTKREAMDVEVDDSPDALSDESPARPRVRTSPEYQRALALRRVMDHASPGSDLDELRHLLTTRQQERPPGVVAATPDPSVPIRQDEANRRAAARALDDDPVSQLAESWSPVAKPHATSVPSNPSVFIDALDSLFPNLQAFAAGRAGQAEAAGGINQREGAAMHGVGQPKGLELPVTQKDQGLATADPSTRETSHAGDEQCILPLSTSTASDESNGGQMHALAALLKNVLSQLAPAERDRLFARAAGSLKVDVQQLRDVVVKHGVQLEAGSQKEASRVPEKASHRDRSQRQLLPAHEALRHTDGLDAAKPIAPRRHLDATVMTASPASTQLGGAPSSRSSPSIATGHGVPVRYLKLDAKAPRQPNANGEAATHAPGGYTSNTPRDDLPPLLRWRKPAVTRIMRGVVVHDQWIVQTSGGGTHITTSSRV